MVMYLIPPADEGPSSVNAPQGRYSQWSSAISQYDQTKAASLGFAIGSVSMASDYRLLIMEVARSATHNSANGEKFERWGYGYRLVVEASNFQGDATVTFPALAAAVELRLAEATVRLEVNGFDDDSLWDLLPVPGPLTVDTYNKFIAAAGVVQKAFGKNPGAAYPVKLAEGDISLLAGGGLSESEMSEALVIIGFLASIRDGVIRRDALTRLSGRAHGVSDDVLDQLSKAVYGWFGAGPDGRPSDRARQLASDRLEEVGF